MFLRKSLFSCYVPLLPRNLAKDRKEGVPLPDVDELILYYPKKAALTTAPWMHLLFPGYSLCILSHECFILLRKKKRHSGENILDVSGICVMTQSILHAYIIVGEKSLTSLRYTIDRQFPYAMRNQTHWIFVGPVLPLCVIAH